LGEGYGRRQITPSTQSCGGGEVGVGSSDGDGLGNGAGLDGGDGDEPGSGDALAVGVGAGDAHGDGLGVDGVWLRGAADGPAARAAVWLGRLACPTRSTGRRPELRASAGALTGVATAAGAR
jgi:hypothetical protein